MSALGLARSTGTAPVARMTGARGPAKNSFFTMIRGWRPWFQASSRAMTQSQLEVCGAPTTIPCRGKEPSVRHRARRRTARARRGRITMRAMG
jgi:hypothetical protein